MSHDWTLRGRREFTDRDSISRSSSRYAPTASPQPMGCVAQIGRPPRQRPEGCLPIEMHIHTSYSYHLVPGSSFSVQNVCHLIQKASQVRQNSCIVGRFRSTSLPDATRTSGVQVVSSQATSVQSLRWSSFLGGMSRTRARRSLTFTSFLVTQLSL